MKTFRKLAEIGGSICVRIPKQMADEHNLKAGQTIHLHDVEAPNEQGTLIILTVKSVRTEEHFWGRVHKKIIGLLHDEYRALEKAKRSRSAAEDQSGYPL